MKFLKLGANSQYNITDILATVLFGGHMPDLLFLAVILLSLLGELF